MEMYEIKPLLEGSYYKNKESWEQARFISYMVAQVNSTKKLTPSDIMSFGWDVETKDTTISTEEIDRLKQKSKMMENNLNI